MQTSQRLVGALRVLLGSAFAALVLVEVFVGLALADLVGVPTILGGGNGSAPDLAFLEGPMLTVSVLEIICVQVVIACTWRLLTMVELDQIFSEEAFVWVDTILGAIAVAWLLLLGSCVYLILTEGVPRLTAALLALLAVGGAVVGLLMIVMRALLRQATTLRTDMESVI